MAAGTTQQTGQLVNQKVHESLFTLFESQDVLVSTQAIWAMGNIAGDCQEYRDEVLLLPDFIKQLLYACSGYIEDAAKKHQILK
jgi:hypothetical protein